MLSSMFDTYCTAFTTRTSSIKGHSTAGNGAICFSAERTSLLTSRKDEEDDTSDILQVDESSSAPLSPEDFEDIDSVTIPVIKKDTISDDEVVVLE